MAHDSAKESVTMKLPAVIAGPADVGRLIRELEMIGDALLQAGLKSSGTSSEVKMPKTSQLMDRAVEANKLNLLHESDRTALNEFLSGVKAQAPLLHISLSADPSPRFTEKLVVWLRREVHPSVLVTVGLQPNIGAGCIVRTTNKQFDFSLRQDFMKKRDLLLKKIAAPPLEPVLEPKASEEAA